MSKLAGQRVFDNLFYIIVNIHTRSKRHSTVSRANLLEGKKKIKMLLDD